MLKGFRDFILRGNVVDLAVAVIIGASFNAIVNAMVKDIMNPLIAATVGKPDFSAIVFSFHGARFLLGDLFNNAFTFLIDALVVYFGIVLPMHYLLQRMKSHGPVPPPPPAMKICPECLSDIPAAARRCSHCTQPQPAVTQGEAAAVAEAAGD